MTIMARFMRHRPENDWCHICGTRQSHNVAIEYPKNAEHMLETDRTKGGKYLRMCAA